MNPEAQTIEIATPAKQMGYPVEDIFNAGGIERKRERTTGRESKGQRESYAGMSSFEFAGKSAGDA